MGSVSRTVVRFFELKGWAVLIVAQQLFIC
jgi:hypothetical protein